MKNCRNRRNSHEDYECDYQGAFSYLCHVHPQILPKMTNSQAPELCAGANLMWRGPEGSIRDSEKRQSVMCVTFA
jgi:hypothetical protein